MVLHMPLFPAILDHQDCMSSHIPVHCCIPAMCCILCFLIPHNRNFPPHKEEDHIHNKIPMLRYNIQQRMIPPHHKLSIPCCMLFAHLGMHCTSPHCIHYNIFLQYPIYYSDMSMSIPSLLHNYQYSNHIPPPSRTCFHSESIQRIQKRCFPMI